MAELANRSEDRVKAAIIDRLIDNAYVDADSVLISEMTVANWSRRADVVLANGRLWAFEVKSDVDSLSRLSGQIEVFSRYFEKLTIVVAERFESAALAMAPTGVGLWTVNAHGALRQRVPPRCSMLSRQAYMSLMTAADLKMLLSANGFRSTKGAWRGELEAYTAKLSARELANAAREAVKRRYRAYHFEFLRQQRLSGTLDAVSALRRGSHIRERAPAPLPSEPPLPETWVVPTDHPLLVNAPGGPVLRRKIS